MQIAFVRDVRGVWFVFSESLLFKAEKEFFSKIQSLLETVLTLAIVTIIHFRPSGVAIIEIMSYCVDCLNLVLSFFCEDKNDNNKRLLLYPVKEAWMMIIRLIFKES